MLIIIPYLIGGMIRNIIFGTKNMLNMLNLKIIIYLMLLSGEDVDVFLDVQNRDEEY